MLKLPTRGAFEELSTTLVQSIQADLDGISYLIIDEKSIISLAQLKMIESRLSQALPRSRPFGGMNIVLCGDFFQLPPVSGSALFVIPAETRLLEIAGRQAYYAFHHTLELTRLMRQQGNGQLAFRSALEGLRGNTLTYRDWQLLASRTATTLSAQERRSFDDATRIYFRNEDVRDCNERRLRETNNPVLKLKAIHDDQAIGSRASIDECSQLEDEIEVAIGCRIMLLANIWTEAGLVNSATRYLHDIE